MTPVPQVPESHSVKFSFQQLEESFRVFATIETSSNENLKEIQDAAGRSFFVALQNPGWVSRLLVTVHRSQQPSGLRTAFLAAQQSGEEIHILDYDTAQIYKTHIILIDPKHRTRIKWDDEYFNIELAVIEEGGFNVQNESQVTWRSSSGSLVPERGYPY